MVNVIPVNDEREHTTQNCWCEPRMEWADAAGVPYPNGPLVIHNSADCREAVERLIGEGLAPDKKWACIES